jgi:hypothetical protein
MADPMWHDWLAAFGADPGIDALKSIVRAALVLFGM